MSVAVAMVAVLPFKSFLWSMLSVLRETESEQERVNIISNNAKIYYYYN